jgi:serine protease Do
MRTYVGGLLLISALTLLAWSGTQGADIRRTPIVEAVERATPAVVNISSYRTDRSSADLPYASTLEEFFRDFIRPSPDRRRSRSLGSGVIVDRKGLILTNEHVVKGAQDIKVTLSDGRRFTAELVGADPPSDLAILRILHVGELPVIPIGTSRDLMIGETVIAIGNPFGLSHTVTTGVISALRRSVKAKGRVYHDFIQTDAAINPGNSGGPLLNIHGELIGINTAIYQKAQGVGFAIPIDRALRIMQDLIRYGEVHPAWIGLEVRDPVLNTNDKGVVVSGVAPGGPAHKAGLREGDLIVGINEELVRDREQFHQVLSGYTAGSRLELVFVRDGAKHMAVVKATRLTPQRASTEVQRLLGIKVVSLSKEVRKSFSLVAKNGVAVVEVRETGPSYMAGMRPGDVILQVNRQEIVDMDDFNRAMVNALRSEEILILIQRGHYGYYLTMHIGGR